MHHMCHVIISLFVERQQLCALMSCFSNTISTPFTWCQSNKCKHAGQQIIFCMAVTVLFVFCITADQRQLVNCDLYIAIFIAVIYGHTLHVGKCIPSTRKWGIKPRSHKGSVMRKAFQSHTLLILTRQESIVFHDDVAFSQQDCAKNTQLLVK